MIVKYRRRQARRGYRHSRRGHDHIQPRPVPPNLLGEAAPRLGHSRQPRRRTDGVTPRIRMVRGKRVRVRISETETRSASHARAGGVPGDTPVLRSGPVPGGAGRAEERQGIVPPGVRAVRFGGIRSRPRLGGVRSLIFMFPMGRWVLCMCEGGGGGALERERDVG